jgi:uncharacterized membrane protein YozB (DUF420 family)
MTLHDIPAINASLNALATVLMTVGFVFIRRGNREAHRACMLSAGAVSAVFLVGYVAHKILVRGVHTPFGGEGAIRSVYYAMLISHIILAIAIAYLVPRTFWLALKGQYERHRTWARWTFPIWYYVSVTGVLVYLFLYVWWPAGRVS